MQRWWNEFARRLVARSEASFSRRGLLGRVGLAAGVGVLGHGAGPTGLEGKKKRNKNRPKPPTLADWKGTWRTRLSNGVQGTATFKNDILGGCCDGTYENSVGSGEFRCYPGTGKETDLGCRWDQTDGSSGDFVIDLTDKDHWKGRYRIDGGGGGTWSGVRR